MKKLESRRKFLKGSALAATATAGTLAAPAIVNDSVVLGGYASGTNIITEDPMLGSLGDYGGFTQTIPIGPYFSSAVDTGDDANCLATDQRGAPRPAGACDSGAYQFISCPDLVLSSDFVAGAETEENCQNIFVGPDFLIMSTGALTLRAGRSVTLGNGTSVDPPGQLTVEIDTDLQLVPP